MTKVDRANQSAADLAADATKRQYRVTTTVHERKVYATSESAARRQLTRLGYTVTAVSEQRFPWQRPDAKGSICTCPSQGAHWSDCLDCPEHADLAQKAADDAYWAEMDAEDRDA